MRQAGEVTYADAHKPRRNEGCVEFASEKVRNKIAIKSVIMGNNIFLSFPGYENCFG